MIANHIPQLVFHYREGICTAAAFSDVRSSMEFRAGVHETTCTRHIILARFLEEAPGKKYSVAVRLDMNRIFYEEMIRRFTAWYDTFPQSPPRVFRKRRTIRGAPPATAVIMTCVHPESRANAVFRRSAE